MTDLYLHPTERPSDSTANDVRNLNNQLLVTWDLLIAFLKSNRTHWLEARSWLISTIGAAHSVSAHTRLSALAPYLPGLPSRSNDQRHRADRRGGTDEGVAGDGDRSWVAAEVQQALIELLCEHCRTEVAAILLDCPELFKAFFEGNEARIQLWFSHVSMEGLPKFRYGAKALGQFALAARDEAWQHLVWQGRHPQAPVSVAAKTHYFCELDIVATVGNLLRNCPRFLVSDPWQACLASGEFLDLDLPWFCQALLQLLQGTSSAGRRLAELLQRWIAQQGGAWQALCQRLLHRLPEQHLLELVQAVAEDGPEVAGSRDQAVQDMAGPGWDDLSGLLLSRGPNGSGSRGMESLEGVVLLHALCCCRHQLWAMLLEQEQQQEPGEGDEQLQEGSQTWGRSQGRQGGQHRGSTAQQLRLLACELHGPAARHTAQAHTSLIMEASGVILGPPASSSSRQNRDKHRQHSDRRGLDKHGHASGSSSSSRRLEKPTAGSSRGAAEGKPLSASWARCLLALEAWTLRLWLLLAAEEQLQGAGTQEEGEAAGSRVCLEEVAAGAGLSCRRLGPAPGAEGHSPSSAAAAAAGPVYELLPSSQDSGSDSEEARRQRRKAKRRRKRRRKEDGSGRDRRQMERKAKKRRHRKRKRPQSDSDDSDGGSRGGDRQARRRKRRRQKPASSSSSSDSSSSSRSMAGGSSSSADSGLEPRGPPRQHVGPGSGAAAPGGLSGSMADAEVASGVAAPGGAGQLATYRLQLPGGAVRVGGPGEVADFLACFACKHWLAAGRA